LVRISGLNLSCLYGLIHFCYAVKSNIIMKHDSKCFVRILKLYLSCLYCLIHFCYVVKLNPIMKRA